MYPLIFMVLISLTALAVMMFYLSLAFSGKNKLDVKTEEEVLKELSEKYKKQKGKKMNTKIKLLGVLLITAFLFTACSNSGGYSSDKRSSDSHSGHNH